MSDLDYLFETTDDPPAKGGFSADEYKMRIAAALADNMARDRKPYEKRIKLGSTAPKETERFDTIKAAKKWLKANGYEFVKVDYWDARFNRTHDLMGLYDLLAFREGETVGVQVTSWSQVPARRKKMLAEERLSLARLGGWKSLILGCSERGTREEWI